MNKDQVQSWQKCLVKDFFEKLAEECDKKGKRECSGLAVAIVDRIFKWLECK